MPGVVFVIGFALLAFAYDLCAQGCALPFRSPPRAAHRVRPRSPLEGCLGIEIIGGEFFLNAIGSLPVRGRTVALSGQALPPPVHIRWVRRLLPMGVPDYLGRYCSSTRSGQIVNTARARESFMPYAIRVWFLATARAHHFTALPLRLRVLLYHCPCVGKQSCVRYRVGVITACYHHVTARASIRLSGSLGPACILCLDSRLRSGRDRFRYLRLRPLLLQPRSLGCEEFVLLPLRIFNYGSAVFSGVLHPACAASSTASSFVASAFCAINSSCRRHFFDLVRYRLITPLLGTYGKDFIWALLPFTVLCRSSHESASGSYSPIVRSSNRHWVVSSNCPHFRRRGTVTDIRSCTSLILADFPFRRLLPLFRASPATVLSVHITPCKVSQSFLIVLILSLISVFMAPAATIPFIEPLLTLSLYLRRLSTPVHAIGAIHAAHAGDDIRVVHALGIINILLNAMRLSRAGILVYVLIKKLDWPATFVCTPCPSVRFDEYLVRFSSAESNSPVRFSCLASSRWLSGINCMHAVPSRKMLSVVRFVSWRDQIYSRMADYSLRAGCPSHRVRAISAALDVRRSRRIGFVSLGGSAELRELPLVGIRMFMSSVPISEECFVVIACFAR
ncbi:hypothetical protein EDB85DRAFT_2247886 [Lactarius pseudohatsudake]|nr:hypothetical protein EDB85DRAFT_2247886 [Lactarius pseudohatsudake]